MTKQTRTTHRFLLAAVLLATLGGCAVYRAEVRQGNFIDATKFAQVLPGMTHEQVKFLIGPPMVIDGFQRGRWDYVYTLESPIYGGVSTSRHIVVFFDDDRVREVKTID